MTLSFCLKVDLPRRRLLRPWICSFHAFRFTFGFYPPQWRNCGRSLGSAAGQHESSQIPRPVRAAVGTTV
jgi:hypothetical protein